MAATRERTVRRRFERASCSNRERPSDDAKRGSEPAEHTVCTTAHDKVDAPNGPGEEQDDGPPKQGLFERRRG